MREGSWLIDWVSNWWIRRELGREGGRGADLNLCSQSRCWRNCLAVRGPAHFWAPPHRLLRLWFMVWERTNWLLRKSPFTNCPSLCLLERIRPSPESVLICCKPIQSLHVEARLSWRRFNRSESRLARIWSRDWQAWCSHAPHSLRSLRNTSHGLREATSCWRNRTVHSVCVTLCRFDCCIYTRTKKLSWYQLATVW